MHDHLKLSGISLQLKQILDALGEAFGFVDAEENFLFVNQVAADIFGYTKEELIGTNLCNYMTPGEFQKVLEQTTNRRDGKVNTYVHTIIRKDGTSREIQSTVSPHFENGGFAGAFGVFRDLTESILDKERLQESEKRFRTVSDVISDFAASFAITETYDFIPEWHSGLLPLREICPADTIMEFDNWIKFCHPDDLPVLKGAIDKLMTEREPITFEYRIRTSEQRYEWFELIANPEMAADSTRIGRVIVAGKNITLKKAIEEELLLTKYMVDHAAESIYITRPDSSIAYANKFACAKLGYTREDMLQMYASDIDPKYTPERREDVWNLIKDRKAYYTESTQRKKDGSLIQTEVNANYFEFNNQKLAVTFVRDVTEKKEIEFARQLTYSLVNSVNLASSIPDIFSKIQKELGKHMDCNNLYLGLLKKEQGMIDTYFLSDTQVRSDRQSCDKTLNSVVINSRKPVLLGNKEIRELESNGLIRANGTPAVGWAGVPLHIGDEIIGLLAISSFENENFLTPQQLELLEYISTHIAMTIQRKLDEDALKTSESNLRESNISKDKFFSIIAHDLRGPFNAIIGFSDLLHNDFESLEVPEQRAMIKNIHDASIGTFKLLENLLEWSRIQTGRTIPNPDNIDLSTIANTSLSFLKPQAEKKNIKLFSGIHFGTMAFCDENMITTVIRNLISNAIKFTPHGGNVRIWSGIRENCIEVTVSDNGTGIPKENIPKLFRLDESVKTRGTAGEQGTGLGLLLCREFIELNMGTIQVESEPGKGSQFKFTLPRQT